MGLEALIPDARADRGRSRAIRAEIPEAIVCAKREEPRRSVRRVIRMLARAGLVKRGELVRATVHRLLATAGISARPVRGPSRREQTVQSWCYAPR